MNKIINYFFDDDEKELIPMYLVLVPLFVIWVITLFVQEEIMKETQKEKDYTTTESPLLKSSTYKITKKSNFVNRGVENE